MKSPVNVASACGDPRRALAKPVPGREKHEPDRGGPEEDLEDPDGRERVGNGKTGGQEIDVERRDEVEPWTERQVAGDHPPGELRVGRRIQPDVRLEERVVPQLQHDEELEDEHGGQAQDGSPPIRLRRCRHAWGRPSWSGLRSSYFSVLSAHIFVARTHLNVS